MDIRSVVFFPRNSISCEKKKTGGIDTCMKEQLLLLGDVARQLGVRPHRIVYALTSGLIPEPALRIGNRRLFDENDLKQLANYFAGRKKNG